MTMSRVISGLKPYRPHLIIGPAFKLIEAILELIIPILIARMIDEGISTGNTELIKLYGLQAFLLASAGLLCALICQFTASYASQGFGTDLRDKLSEKILFLPREKIDSIGASSLVNRINSDTAVLQHAVAMLIRLVVRAPFLSIGALVMAIAIDWQLSIIFMIVLPIFVAVLALIMKKSVKYNQDTQRGLDNISSVLQENLDGVRVIRAFNSKQLRSEKFAGANHKLTGLLVKVGSISGWLNPATMLLLNLSIIAVLWFGGRQIDHGRLSRGEIVALINYLSQTMMALIVVANLVVIYARAYASALRAEEVLSAADKPSVETGREADCVADYDQAANLKSYTTAAVRFKDVGFTYPGASRPLFQNLAFSIEKGGITGLIGPTGSGKTSVLNILLNLYELEHGQIELFGKNTRGLSLSQINRQIGYVPQRSVLLSGTIAENMRLGKPDATDEEIWHALRLAQAEAFVKEKEGGLKAPVKRGGQNFSGGQRQRLAIARALITKPDILVFDDSTSALDYATDSALRFGITHDPDFAGMTWIIISQRIANIAQADQILLMDDGRLIASGTHEQLMFASELYRDMYHSQQDGRPQNAGGKI